MVPVEELQLGSLGTCQFRTGRGLNRLELILSGSGSPRIERLRHGAGLAIMTHTSRGCNISSTLARRSNVDHVRSLLIDDKYGGNGWG